MVTASALTIAQTVAIFRQINKEEPRAHHDALEFPDGRTVLLTMLWEGQEAVVLQLPAQPSTVAEEEVQKRVAYVGWNPLVGFSRAEAARQGRPLSQLNKENPAHVSGGLGIVAERGCGGADLPCLGDYVRESSDNPRLNALCRVAPSVRFKDRAISAAGVFFRASVFSSRTWTDVQARFFVPLLIRI
jgi:hypothetical protein